jgi:hypothetical protein
MANSECSGGEIGRRADVLSTAAGCNSRDLGGSRAGCLLTRSRRRRISLRLAEDRTFRALGALDCARHLRIGDTSGSTRCGLRQNLEAPSEELMERKRDEVLRVIRGWGNEEGGLPAALSCPRRSGYCPCETSWNVSCVCGFM